MKTYNKLILSILGSAFVVGTVLAQSWTVNGSTQPLQLSTSSTESAVAIDPLTGVANINTSGSPQTVQISAAPSTVFVNNATTVSWSTSGFTGSLNCTRTSSPALGGWSGSSTLASGSVSVTMPSTPQSVTLTLSCTAGNGSAGNSTNVTVNSPSVVGCEQRPPAVLGSPRTLITRQFFEAFNTNFPGQYSVGFAGGASGIADGTVTAFQFVAPPVANTVLDDGYLQVFFQPERPGTGVMIAAFSSCPGDISAVSNLNGTQCTVTDTKVRSEWTVRPPGTANGCQFIPGQTYYYNLSVTNAGCKDLGGQPAECGYRLFSRRYF